MKLGSMVISVSSENKLRRVGIHTHGLQEGADPDELEHKYDIIEDEEIDNPDDDQNDDDEE